MHLESPALTTTGKRKGKKKFASAEAKRKFEEQAASWQALLDKYGEKKVVKEMKTYLKDVYKLTVPEGRSGRHIPSRDTGGGSATLAAPKVYTGTKVKGIATMHKSNAVPVFSDEEAVEISKMRR
jgi:hypothetical protein